MLYNLVSSFGPWIILHPSCHPVDRASLSKDPNSHDSQVYTQLAHAIVRFMGLNSPQDMAEYGLNNAAELVDLVSRVSHSICSYDSLF